MPAACTQDEPADGKGIGHDMTGTGEATKVDGNWAAATTAMNAAQTGTGWRYATAGDAPPTLQKQ